jgi:enamine deaminase RidA (YjgF/YER057c/UK114 family)
VKAASQETIMPEITFFSPNTVGRPVGPYSQISRVKASELIFIAGQTATDVDGNLVGGGDVVAQAQQVFANIEALLKSVGADWRNVVHFTNYLVNPADLPKFAEYRRGVFPAMFGHGGYPPNTLLYVDRLLHKEYLVEVQAIAAL